MRLKARRWPSGLIILCVILTHLVLLEWLNHISPTRPLVPSMDTLEVALLKTPTPQPPAPSPRKRPSPPIAEPTTPAPVEAISSIRSDDGISSETPETGAPAAQATGSEWLNQNTFQYPPAIHLRYEAKGQSSGLNYFATSHLLWQHDETNYQAQLNVSAFLVGSRRFISEGHLGAHGLMPDRYFNPAREDQRASFDYTQARISFSDQSSPTFLLEGAQDRLSVFLQLSTLVASQPLHYSEGQLLTFSTASTSGTESWTFVIEKQETLALPYGAIPALKLSRVLQTPQDQRIEVWLAPQIHDLPVRMLITKPNGDFVDQLLSAVENPSP